ncbi:hypothetical protein EMMF5_002951 [Cystobasidiomycetes sp. EMM_F5]
MSAEVNDDAEFLRGLESILGPMRQGGASQAELDVVARRAREFFLARKQQHQPSTKPNEQSIESGSEIQYSDTTSKDAKDADTIVLASQGEQAQDEPQYPVTFEQLAEMIATGTPIPGIREIPNKLNESTPTAPIVAGSAHAARKPWESTQQIPVDTGLSDILGSKDDAMPT